MSAPYLPSEELLRLLGVLADGELTEEQESRLAAILHQDQQARAYYLDYVALLTSLQWEYAAAAAPGEPAGMGPPPARPRRRSRFVLLGAVGLSGLAAGLLLALTLPRQRPPDRATPAAERAEPTDDSVAVLLQAPGARWDETDRPLRPGAPLRAGRLRLQSGSAHIQFYSGATVLLEGPADFRLISPHEAYCARGRLRATVPPQAQGFTIGSPKLDLVDVGTEFGLRVDGGDQTEVHVFQGKVELYEAGANREAAARQELTTGRGLRLDGPGAGTAIVADPAAFPTAQKVEARALDEARRRHRDWLAASERLRRDPRLLVYYTFQPEQPWGRTLPDRVQGRQEPRNGVIVGCDWVPGRWPGKQALEFKRPGDRVRVNLPGEYASLTFMAWVRIDSLEHRFIGLLTTDRWGDGRPHWQLMQEERLSLTVLRYPGEHDQFQTPPILGPAHLGQWTHLAAVYDRRVGQATHYLNGRAVSAHPIRYPRLLQIGPAEIGNWRAPPHGHPNPIRNLNGRMDEFLLFNEPLGEREIQDLYEAGRPDS
jgi:ferric-dicitrate binding protein FerR (iron transport regulator)